MMPSSSSSRRSSSLSLSYCLFLLLLIVLIFSSFISSSHNHGKRPRAKATKPNESSANTSDYDYEPSANISNIYTGATALPVTPQRISDLPRFFDWCNLDGISYCSTSWNQHIPRYCGSCYVHGALHAANDRIKILLEGKHDLTLARQVILNCAPSHGLGAGCDGGEGFDVFEYMHRYGLPDESCQNYIAQESPQCDQQAICQNCMPIGQGIFPYKCWAVPSPILYYVHSYGALHGEAQMMSEILARGPITCGFASVDDFDYNYRGGIYYDRTNATEMNHDVEVVGWGEDENGLKYWKARNSWGSYWGENSFFKIARGINNMQFESDCVFAIFDVHHLRDVLKGILGGSMFGLVQQTDTAFNTSKKNPHVGDRSHHHHHHHGGKNDDDHSDARQHEVYDEPSSYDHHGHRQSGRDGIEPTRATTLAKRVYMEHLKAARAAELIQDYRYHYMSYQQPPSPSPFQSQTNNEEQHTRSMYSPDDDSSNNNNRDDDHHGDHSSLHHDGVNHGNWLASGAAEQSTHPFPIDNRNKGEDKEKGHDDDDDIQRERPAWKPYPERDRYKSDIEHAKYSSMPEPQDLITPGERLPRRGHHSTITDTATSIQDGDHQTHPGGDTAINQHLNPGNDRYDSRIWARTGTDSTTDTDTEADSETLVDQTRGSNSSNDDDESRITSALLQLFLHERTRGNTPFDPKNNDAILAGAFQAERDADDQAIAAAIEQALKDNDKNTVQKMLVRSMKRVRQQAKQDIAASQISGAIAEKDEKHREYEMVKNAAERKWKEVVGTDIHIHNLIQQEPESLLSSSSSLSSLDRGGIEVSNILIKLSLGLILAIIICGSAIYAFLKHNERQEYDALY